MSEITKKVTASRDDNLEARTFIKESSKKRAGATKLHKNLGKRVVGTLSRSAKALLPPLMYFFPPTAFFFANGVDPHTNLLLEVESFKRKEFSLTLTSFAFAGNIGRRLRKSLPHNRQHGHRCKGCGRKDLLGFAKQTMQNGNQLRMIRGALCTDCQGLVDRLRQDDRITAVFIFSRGKETKYYAAFINSAS